MVIKRRDFQKAAAFIHEFLLKMNEDVECAELRDTLNLALLHMHKYYKLLQGRSHEKNAHSTLTLSARGLSPMTPFVDAPDKFRWRWINLDNARLPSNMSVSESINLTILPPIIQAVKAGNIPVMQDLIQQDGAAVDDADGIGRTGLMYAVHHTEHNALNLLLESQADVNATAHDGSTACHYASHEGNVVALSLLLDHGGNVCILDTQGRAPIHWAVTTPNTDCLELLLDNNVDPTMRDKDGLTPCMWACRMDHIKHFDLLCRADYRLSELDGIERDGNGRTWMHWAVRRTEPLECLQTLLTADSARYKDEDGKTVLMLAAEIGSLPATRLILEIAGTDTLDDCDSQSRTALHLAVIRGHGDVVNFLLEQGADINQPDLYNATAWDYARTRQLHYCQLIVMSHQRQRMISNPTSPLPNGLGLMMHSENGVHEDFRRMSVQTRSEQSTPLTPPHPPKRPRTSRMLQRRANSLTTPDRDRDSSVTMPDRDRDSTGQQSAPPLNTRLTSSAGPERKKERIEVTVNTRQATSNAFMPPAAASRQDSMVTDEDMVNVMNDTEINPNEDIDNVSVDGGMDVSDIEDNHHHNGHTHTSFVQPHTQVGMGRGGPVQRPALVRQPSLRQPRPPEGGGGGFQTVPPPHPHPPTAAPAYTQPLDPPYNQDEGISTPSQPPSSQPQPTPVLQPPGTSKSSSLYAPQAPPRPTLRSSQKNQQQQCRPSGEGEEQAPSPQPSSQSSDQVSVRTQISVGVGHPGGGGGGSDPNRPNSGGTSSKNTGVSIEGHRIPPSPILTPLHNAPMLPLEGLYTPSNMEPLQEQRKKKKKKKGRMMLTPGQDAEGKAPPQNPLEIPAPRGYAAPLHPSRERGHSAALHGPRYSRGQPQPHLGDQRYVEENTQDDVNNDSSKPPAIVNGVAMPIREGTLRSARPGQCSQPMETQDPLPGPGGDNQAWGSHGDRVQQSIAEEDEVGEMGGAVIPAPQAFWGSSTAQQHPLSVSIPQDKSSLRMAPTSAKPPLPRSQRHSASLMRRSSDKNPSPTRRSRPPTSKAN